MIEGIIGVVAGIASGMGIGGGTILIPALILFLGIGQQTAQSVNLIYFVPTAIAALIIHIKNKNINYKVALFFILFGLAGAALGSFGASILPAKLLRYSFAGLLLIFGVMEVFKKREER